MAAKPLISTAAAIAMSLALAGCSGGGLTTGSLFGGGASQASAPLPPANDPTARALQVGSTAARAAKCGYNFDPVRLRANFLAAEAAANPAGTGNLEKIYDTAYGGVTKAVAADGTYCSKDKTAEIKEQLNRHLAGDYTPAPRKVVASGGGLFDAVGDGNETAAAKDKFGSDEWWADQEHKSGNH